jgi:hypothetical protein
MQPAQPQRPDYTELPSFTVSPISMASTPVSDEKHVVFSPAEKTAYFPDDKICMPVADGIELREAVSDSAPQLAPPKYAEADLPDRQKRASLWRRHIWWIIASAVILIILIGILLGLAFKSHSGTTTTRKVIVTNSTANSVASSGLTLRDGTTWNMHLFAQNKTGSINLQISLDGGKFETVQKVPLTIQPRVGSPMSATAEQDQETGVVMVNMSQIYSCHESLIVQDQPLLSLWSTQYHHVSYHLCRRLQQMQHHLQLSAPSRCSSERLHRLVSC